MKRESLLLTGISCVIFVCCQSEITEPVAGNEENHPVCFNLQLQKEVLPFPEARSIPPLNIPEPEAIEADTLLYKYLEYVVYTSEETPRQLKHKYYTWKDEDFGIIYDTLPGGNFSISFLAHNTAETSFSGNTIRFNEVNDTFFRNISLLVEEQTDITQDIILSRQVGKIEFKAADPIPEEVHSLTISASNYLYQFNLLTGKAIPDPKIYEQIYHFTNKNNISGDGIYGFYTFIPDNPLTMEVDVVAGDLTGNTLKRHLLTNVIPQLNKIIRYTGNLFTSSSDSENTFVIEIKEEGEWEEEDKILEE